MKRVLVAEDNDSNWMLMTYVLKRNYEPVQVSEDFLSELFATIQNNPDAEVEVDLPNQTVSNKVTGRSEHFDINGYKKHCLMNGLDDIDFLVANKDKIEIWEQQRR